MCLNFANGAATAAFLQTTVAAAEYYKKIVGHDASIVPGTKYATGKDGICCAYEPEAGTGRFPRGPGYDISGFNIPLDGSWLFPRNWLKQGGLIGRFVNYVLPFGAPTTYLYDTWRNSNPAIPNVRSMLPAYAISAAAVPGRFFRGWQSEAMAWSYVTDN